MFQRVCSAFVFIFCLVAATTANATNNEAVAAKIKELLETRDAAIASTLEQDFDQVKVFYATRNFKPIWVRDDGPKSKGKALLQELKRSKLHGLSPSFYRTETLDKLVSQTAPTELAKLDLLFSAAFIDYSADLKNGHANPSSGFGKNLVEPVLTTADALVKGAAEAGNFRNMAKLFLTPDERYFRLIAKFLELVRIERAGNWPQIAADGKPIGAGKTDPRIKKIRVLLALSQDLAPNQMTGDNTLGVKLQNAVKSYQQRHGLPQSGEIDRATLAFMAVPLKQYMNQILVNLERRRWQNRNLGPNHLYINLADGMGRLVLDGETVGFFGIEAPTDLPAFYGNLLGFERDSQNPELARLVLEAKPPATDAIEGKSIGMKVPKNWKPNSAFASLAKENLPTFGSMVLKKPLGLYITYLTTWSDKAGTHHVRKDVANRDPALMINLGLQ